MAQDNQEIIKNVTIFLKNKTKSKSFLYIFILFIFVFASEIGYCQYTPEEQTKKINQSNQLIEAKKYNEAYDILKPMADNGDPSAMVLLAKLYCKGEGTEQNYKEALRLFRLSYFQWNKDIKMFELFNECINKLGLEKTDEEKQDEEILIKSIKEARKSDFLLAYQNTVSGANIMLAIAKSKGKEIVGISLDTGKASGYDNDLDYYVPISERQFENSKGIVYTLGAMLTDKHELYIGYKKGKEAPLMDDYEGDSDTNKGKIDIAGFNRINTSSETIKDGCHNELNEVWKIIDGE